MSTSLIKQNSAALLGCLCILPNSFLNMILSKRLEPFFALIHPGPQTNAIEVLLVYGSLFLIPLGALIALRPLLQADPAERRAQAATLSANLAVAAMLMMVFLILLTGLGTDITTCNIQSFPNCQ